jgi:hypothetical protein
MGMRKIQSMASSCLRQIPWERPSTSLKKQLKRELDARQSGSFDELKLEFAISVRTLPKSTMTVPTAIK